MQVFVEFLGVSRLVAGIKETEIDLPPGATWHDLVHFLSVTYPGMIGDVIRPDRQTLQAPNIFNLDGKKMIGQDQMQDSLQDGDRVVLMSMSAGG